MHFFKTRPGGGQHFFFSYPFFDGSKLIGLLQCAFFFDFDSRQNGRIAHFIDSRSFFNLQSWHFERTPEIPCLVYQKKVTLNPHQLRKLENRSPAGIQDIYVPPWWTMRNEQLLGAHIDIPSACLHWVDIWTTENKAQVVLGGCIAGELLSCLVGIMKSFSGIFRDTPKKHEGRIESQKRILFEIGWLGCELLSFGSVDWYILGCSPLSSNITKHFRQQNGGRHI